MRAEEIEKLPVIIDMMLGESVIVDTKEKLHEKLTEVCNLAIKALEQEPRWIPVTERLPEDRELLLVTAYWHETYQVMVGAYFGNGDWWCAPWNNTSEPQQLLKVKAWMPLPEPYKAESEG